jgi:CubicO group peptidase (beta-lactamase class C family)
MVDTAVVADPERLATAYTPGDDALDLLDPPDGAYADPGRFTKLSGGLVSTVGDVMRFYTALADGGAPVLDRASVALTTADALTAEQRRQARPIVGARGSWGLATGVDVETAEP